MNKTLFAFIIIFSLCSVTSTWAKEDSSYFPTPVPVNLAPGNYDDSYWGIGYNIINLKSDWEDNFFTFEEEHVGDIEYQVQHIVLAFLKSKRQRSSVEYDFLVGKITSKEGIKRYYSDLNDRELEVDHSGDGIDIGMRLIYSRNIYRQLKKKGQERFIDWNYAFSLHAAYYYTEGTYSARSVDGQYANEYTSEEEGIFLRPVLSLQPVIDLGDRVSLIPYVGIGTKISLWFQNWEDTEYISKGSNQPGQKGWDEESGIDFSGMETYIGFDVGIKTNSSNNHQLTIGGVLTKLFGENDSDFAEVHVVYSLPFSFNKYN